MIGEPPELADRAALARAAALFPGLSDAGRLALLRRLVAGEARVVDLVANLAMPQSTVSTHLGCLRDCDLLDDRPHGRAPVYFLAHPELLDVVAAAETLLAASGDAVALGAGHGNAENEPCPDTANPRSRHEESIR